MLGFSSGGDDYLVKPFSYNELVSRAKALIRRYHVYQGKNMPVRGSGIKGGARQSASFLIRISSSMRQDGKSAEMGRSLN